MKKTMGRKWAAAAMALAAGVMTAGAVEPVLDNLPGAPGQSRAYWEAVRAEAAAKKAADKAAASAMSVNAQAGGDFFTGKPYDADLGGYVFKYRTYDPHLGRWTTPDPSGFPDGANGYCYWANSLAAVDSDGLVRRDVGLDYGIGRYDFYFEWSLAKNHEFANIGNTPGWSGIRSTGVSMNINGVNVGGSATYHIENENTSKYEYQMRDGYQWKRYVVEMKVYLKRQDVYLVVTLDNTVLTANVKDVAWGEKLVGEWYE